MTLEELYVWARLRMNAAGLKNWTVGYVGGTPNYMGTANHGLKRITLAAMHLYHLPTREQEDTVLHEMAHALIPGNHKHDATWKAKAALLGANPMMTGNHGTPAEAYPVIATCEQGCRIGRNRMPAEGVWGCLPHDAPLTFTRKPKQRRPFEVTEALRLYGVPKPARPAIGTTVRLVAPGHPLHGMEGTLTKLGRTRAYVDIGHPGGDVIIPLENATPVQ